jgi:uncharacterized RDD family membrane protein YckC
LRCQSCGHDNPPEARFCANCGSSLATIIEPPAPALAQGAEPAVPEVAVAYMGFWIRLAAAIIDFLVILAVSSLLSFLHPAGGAFSILVYWLYYWLFTGLKGQTLGKMAVGIKVVNAAGAVPGLGRAALREIPGKIVSTIAIFIGFLWVIWDKQKQGWHDKIASTYVVNARARGSKEANHAVPKV